MALEPEQHGNLDPRNISPLQSVLKTNASTTIGRETGLSNIIVASNNRRARPPTVRFESAFCSMPSIFKKLMPNRNRDREHPRNNPVSYRQLSQRDVQDLADVLSIRRYHGHSRRVSRRDQEIRGNVARLPSHLRSGFFRTLLMNPFCSVHGGLSPGPVVSLTHALRNELNFRLPASWQHVGAFRLRFNPEGRVYLRAQLDTLFAVFDEPHQGLRQNHGVHIISPAKCAACSLTVLGRNIEDLAALGAVLLGHVSRRRGLNSTRVVYIEEAIFCAADSREQAETVIRRMHKGGRRLRRLLREERHREDSMRASRGGSVADWADNLGNLEVFNDNDDEGEGAGNAGEDGGNDGNNNNNNGSGGNTADNAGDNEGGARDDPSDHGSTRAEVGRRGANAGAAGNEQDNGPQDGGLQEEEGDAAQDNGEQTGDQDQDQTLQGLLDQGDDHKA